MDAIRTEKLCRTFGSIKALDNVSINIRQGEVFGLLGPNGAGKTTFIRVLLGLITPNSGYAEVLGYNIRKEINKIREQIALLPQEAEVYPTLTARENVVYYAGIHGQLSKEEIESRTVALMEEIGLSDRANDLCKGFSGGMKRKVLVARTLVLNPKIIFLDEPTTGIDVLGARRVRTMLHQLSKQSNRTIVLTTHDLNEVEQLCDRVAIMVSGKVVSIGKPSELEAEFRGAKLEDVFVALATGEGV
ncbi:MAG: ABC transporter ATP-binding protein [Candidatus Hermodarchaeota archaeon]